MLDSKVIKKNIEEYLELIDEVNSKGKFKDTWSSLYQYEVPKWYKNAKIGIFYHYGVYTVPQNRSEWYSRNMYQQGSVSFNFHLEKYGNHKDFGYKELIELFKAQKFNPKEWVDLANSLGAKYMIPVAEHHDGFQMYNSKFSDYNAYKMGPKKDIIKELMLEANKENVKFAVSSHRAEHYWFMDGALDFDSGIGSPVLGDIYWPTIKEEDLNQDKETTKLFLEDWLVRCCELVDLFKPYVVYFDWWIEMPIFKPYMRKFLAYYYNRCIEFGYEGGVVNYKHDGVPYLVAVRDVERGQFSTIQMDYWQCCTSSARNSWSYTEQNEYKTAKELIQTFIDVISKNGNLLLNSGPKKDGTIPKEELSLFKEIGDWIKVNEEAIYDSRTWKVFGEGDYNTSGGNFSEGIIPYKKYDVRFTMNKNNIYVFLLNPENETVFDIKSMAISKGILTHHAVIKNVSAVDNKIVIDSYTRTKNALVVKLKEHDSTLPIVLKVEIE